VAVLKQVAFHEFDALIGRHGPAVLCTCATISDFIPPEGLESRFGVSYDRHLGYFVVQLPWLEPAKVLRVTITSFSKTVAYTRLAAFSANVYGYV
jgi:hypothetical protein